MFIYAAAVSLCPTGLLSVDGVKEVSVKDLLSELEEVTTSWFVLGVFLNIPESKLCEIRQDCDNDEECKMEMIILWRTLCIPTWNAVADALAKIGMHSLAIKLARKYGKIYTYQIGLMSDHSPVSSGVGGIPFFPFYTKCGS